MLLLSGFAERTVGDPVRKFLLSLREVTAAGELAASLALVRSHRLRWIAALNASRKFASLLAQTRTWWNSRWLFWPPIRQITSKLDTLFLFCAGQP
jgi:hypothetical protein